MNESFYFERKILLSEFLHCHHRLFQKKTKTIQINYRETSEDAWSHGELKLLSCLEPRDFWNCVETWSGLIAKNWKVVISSDHMESWLKMDRNGCEDQEER